MKLIADSCILHACTHKLLESIVVTINFESIGNDVLYTIVMTYNLYFVNHTELWLAATWTWNFRKDLVVMTSDQQIWNCVSWSDLNLAVVAPQDNSIAWLHQCHADTVVGNVDWVIDSTTVSSLIGIAMPTSLTPSSVDIGWSLLWVVDIAIVHSSRLPTEVNGSKLLLKIYKDKWKVNLLVKSENWPNSKQ